MKSGISWCLEYEKVLYLIGPGLRDMSPLNNNKWNRRISSEKAFSSRLNKQRKTQKTTEYIGTLACSSTIKCHSTTTFRTSSTKNWQAEKRQERKTTISNNTPNHMIHYVMARSFQLHRVEKSRHRENNYKPTMILDSYHDSYSLYYSQKSSPFNKIHASILIKHKQLYLVINKYLK